MRVRRVTISLLFSALSTAASAGSVKVDGSTSTGVTLRPNGQIAIDPARPNQGGVSHNRYTHFSVPKEGVAFSNGNAGASVILNEVTGTARTGIAGPVTVEGRRAHVVIANPNGIEVNGGTFVNTGRVTLTTGKPGLADDGRLSIDTTAGEIRVRAGGLAGALQDLDLIAKRIRLQGAVTAAGRVELRAGASAVDLAEGGVSGVRERAAVDVASDDIAVDISSRSLLTGGAVRIAVNDRGAGVRLQEADVATSGRFQLDARGLVDIRDATVVAEGVVQIKADGVRVTSASKAAKVASSTNSVEIVAGSAGLLSEGASIEGATRNFEDLSSVGAVTLRSSGALSMRSAAGLDASIVGGKDDIVLLADGDIRLDGANVRSDRDVLVNGNLRAEFADVKVTAKRDVKIGATHDVSLVRSTLGAGGNVRVESSRISVGALERETTQTSLKAEKGSVTLKAVDGDILNYGGLVQGDALGGGDPDARGAVTILASGAFINRSVGTDRIATVFGVFGDLVIDADGAVRNETGRLLSNGAIRIDAAGEFANVTMHEEGRGERSSKSSGFSWRSLFLFPTRDASYSVDYGELVIPGETSAVTAAGNLTVSAERITNKGGQLSGDAVKLTSATEILNDSFVTGEAAIETSCGWFCKAKGSDSISTVFSSISANTSLSIDALDRYASEGGRLFSNSGITITAADVSTSQLVAPFVVTRPGGLAGLFLSEAAWIGWGAESALVFADKGDFVVTSRKPARWSGAQFVVGGKRVLSAGEEIVAVPSFPDRIGWRSVGMMSGAPW